MQKDRADCGPGSLRATGDLRGKEGAVPAFPGAAEYHEHGRLSLVWHGPPPFRLRPVVVHFARGELRLDLDGIIADGRGSLHAVL